MEAQPNKPQARTGASLEKVPGNGVLKSSEGRPQVMPEKLGLAEHKRQEWVVDINPELTLEAILDPSFWAHVSTTLKAGDRIEARWEDGSRYVNLRVLYAERTFAKVGVISDEKHGEVVSEIPAELQRHYVKWKGPTMKHCVIRTSDNQVVQDGFAAKGLAEAWAIDHERQ